MKALVKNRDERGLWLQDVPEPEMGINDVKIRVLYTGICGTDLHIFEWDAWARSTIKQGLTIGHEFVGEIVAIGSNVEDVAIGQIVSGEGHVVCGRCRNCLAGRRHLCAHTMGVGVNRNGAFAEFIVLPMSNIWQHSPASRSKSHPSSTPSATPSTPRSHSPYSEKTSSSPEPDPSASWPPQ